MQILDYVQLALQVGDSYLINQQDKLGWTFLHYAIYLNQVKIVQDLLAAPNLTTQTINAVNQEGITALHYAVVFGKIKLVKLLLQSQRLTPTTINRIDNYGHTALSYALQFGQLPMIKLLLCHQGGSFPHLLNQQQISLMKLRPTVTAALAKYQQTYDQISLIKSAK